MKKQAWIVGFLCLTVIIVLFVRNHFRERSDASRPAGANSSATAANPPSASRATEPTNRSASPAPASGSPVANFLTGTNEVSALSNRVAGGQGEGPNLPPATVLENMRVAVRAYGSMFNGNPIGTNPEITKALHGDNPKQVNFIREDEGFRINGHGELIDPWGTPFFFHQLSATEMEIRSAGRDRILYTPDDLVTK
jgi:hypothetical protein